MRLAVVIAVIVASRLATAAPTVGEIVTGDPTLQAPVRAQIESWARAHHFVVVDAPLGEHAKTFIDCFVIEDIKCAHGVFDRQTLTDGVFLVRVELVAGPTRELAFTGYWFVKGHDAVGEKRSCKDCDAAAQKAALDSLLDALLATTKLVAPTPPPEHGSRLLPGIAIGVGAGLLAGGATYLYYGHLDGRDQPYRYPDATRTGLALTVTGALAIAGGSSWWRKAERRESLLPAVLIAAGGVAALGGGAIALHYAAKQGPDEPFVYPDAVKVGAPLAIAGGGAIVAGTLLILWGRAPSGSPQATVTAGGATIGWAGSL